jgi:RsiW-degrading membrane proteinase PrsW (M82 family)
VAAQPLAALSLSLTPVIVFLVALGALDTYKLLTVRRVIVAVLAGVLAAGVCYPINTAGFSRWGGSYSHLGAPTLEELAKSAYIFYCVAGNRVGFPVDAAVMGFAVGTGFSLVENVVYLFQLPPAPSLLVWLVRGAGTAMMHGCVSAIVAIVAIALWVRWRWLALVAALAAGTGLHALYNSGVLQALERAAVILLTLPAVLMLVFWQSERMLARWLHVKLDDDLRTLDSIESGTFLDSPAGLYLQSLRDSFKPEVVADLFCLLRLSAELSIKAKAELLQREAGFTPTPADPERVALLGEMARLEHRVGRAGRRALAQLLSPGARDRWERMRMQTL